jgi:hypothetical protein
MDMHSAVERSCNTYFWATGLITDPAKTTEMVNYLGYGQNFDLPVPSQRYGTMPNPEWLKTIDVKALPPEGRLESDDLAETVIAKSSCRESPGPRAGGMPDSGRLRHLPPLAPRAGLPVARNCQHRTAGPRDLLRSPQ